MEIQQKTNKQRYQHIKSTESQPISTQKTINGQKKSPPKLQFRKPNKQIGTIEYEQIINNDENGEQETEQIKMTTNQRKPSQIKSRAQSKASSNSKISIHTHTVGRNSQYNPTLTINPNMNIQIKNENNDINENAQHNDSNSYVYDYPNTSIRSVNKDKDNINQQIKFGMIKKNKISNNSNTNIAINQIQNYGINKKEQYNPIQNNFIFQEQPKINQSNRNNNINKNKTKFGVIAHILPSEQFSIANNSQVESKSIYNQQDSSQKQFVRSRPFNKTIHNSNDKKSEKKHKKQQKIGKQLEKIYDPQYKDQLLTRPRNTSPIVNHSHNKKINYHNSNSSNKKSIINKQILIDNYGGQSQVSMKSKHSQSQFIQNNMKQIPNNNKIYGYNNRQNKKMQPKSEMQREQLAKYYNNQSQQDMNSFIHQISSDYNSTGSRQNKINARKSNDNQYRQIKSNNMRDMHNQHSFSPTNKLFHKGKTNQNQQNNKTTYGPGGIQTLEFNPQKQKLIVLQSKQTERNIHLGQFVQDFQIPIPQPIPTLQNTPQELVDIAKANFVKFGCFINDQTLINVKKYKNCVHFSISNEQNILWHYDTGKFYFGAWKMLGNGEGQKSGDGIEYMPFKYKFKGHFVSGKRSGYGILINFDCSAYVGQWQSGLKHGQGRQLSIQGIVYEGEWKQGKRNGFGRLINNGRLQFEGIFERGLKNGHGKQYFENGDFYDGNYVDHKFEGSGNYYWMSGAVYNGQFKQGKRDGFGVWKSSGDKCDIYEGYYKEDKKDGKGIYKWPNGAVYQGHFKDDLKHGEGKIIYENGAIANLVWKKGQAEKKLQQAQINDEQQKSLLTKVASERKFSNDHLKRNPSSKSNQFMVRNKPSSRSTQNLRSSRSSANSANNLPNPIIFNTNKSKKSLSNFEPKNGFSSNQSNKMIKFKVENLKDQNNFQIGINRNILQRRNESNKKNHKLNNLPKEKPYQGIQTSSNINLN